MPSIGGDLTEITFNHPTLGSGVLLPKSGEDNTLDPGGFRSNDDANAVAASGDPIHQLNRVRWAVECTLAGDMNTREDLETLADLAASPVDADWTITHINGTVYAGTGRPVGDVAINANAATIALKLAGGGKLQKIS